MKKFICLVLLLASCGSCDTQDAEPADAGPPDVRVFDDAGCGGVDCSDPAISRLQLRDCCPH